MEKRQPIQVEVIVYRITSNGKLLILGLLRTREWGGFWQPVTGGVLNGETLEEAALREVYEETGITKPLCFFNLNYKFTFDIPERYKIYYDDDVDKITEYVFGYETDIEEIRLSDEHEEYCWVTLEKAMGLYKFPEYHEALTKLVRNIN